jgi:hypothetical protein
MSMGSFYGCVPPVSEFGGKVVMLCMKVVSSLRQSNVDTCSGFVISTRVDRYIQSQKVVLMSYCHKTSIERRLKKVDALFTMGNATSQRGKDGQLGCALPYLDEPRRATPSL